MRHVRKIIEFLGSKALTLWLAGIFIGYYVTIAVWSREAFAHLVQNLSDSNLLRALYLLVAVNITLRIIHTMRALWPAKFVFFFRLPLYAGVFLLLFTFFLSVNFRQNTWLLAGEGDIISAPWERNVLRVAGIRPALERNALKTEDSLIFSSEPAITLLDEKGTSHTIGAFPPRLVGSTYMHILNFGIGPGVELRREKSILSQGYVALRLTPFGKVDKFELPPSPYTFYLSILPNRIIKKGKETAREYNLEKPMYGIEIVKGDKMIAKGETDDTIRFDQGMSLAFHPPSDWVLLDVAYDPFLPLFVIGLIMTGAGSIVYPISFIPFKNRRSNRMKT